LIYDYLKIVHVISACLLFGTGLGTAAYMFFAHRTKNIRIIAPAFRLIVKADWYFTLTSGIVQLITGMAMVFIHNLDFSSFWIWGSLLGYLIAGACWLPVVYIQIRLKNIAKQALSNREPLPTHYYKMFSAWFWLGWPAFLSLIGVFYLMANRPEQPFWSIL
jgi:uncharacterized membrane protein